MNEILINGHGKSFEFSGFENPELKNIYIFIYLFLLILIFFDLISFYFISSFFFFFEFDNEQKIYNMNNNLI